MEKSSKEISCCRLKPRIFWFQRLCVSSQELELYKEEAKHNRMETQDNGFLLVIDGVRKEKERLTAAKLLVFYLLYQHVGIKTLELGSQRINAEM